MGRSSMLAPASAISVAAAFGGKGIAASTAATAFCNAEREGKRLCRPLAAMLGELGMS